MYGACTGEEQQRRWPARWRDTSWPYWGLASVDGQGDRGRQRRQRITSGQTVLYASDEKVHKGGVAITMSKRAERALMEWTPVSKQIITARFYSRFRRLSVI